MGSAWLPSVVFEEGRHLPIPAHDYKQLRQPLFWVKQRNQAGLRDSAGARIHRCRRRPGQVADTHLDDQSVR